MTLTKSPRVHTPEHTKLLIALENQLTDYLNLVDKNAQLLNPETIYVSTDAEWMCGSWEKGFKKWVQSACLVTFYRDHQWITRLLLSTSVNLPEVARKVIIDTFGDLAILYEQEIPELMTLVEGYLLSEGLDSKHIDLIIKYSPLDLHAFFGEQTWLTEMVENNLVSQKRNIRFENTGSYGSPRTYKPKASKYNYKLRDMQGLDPKSLKAQASGVNVKLYAKDIPEHYYEDMMLAYTESPVMMTVYNLCDTIGVASIAIATVPPMNETIRELGLPDSCRFTLDNIPLTTGSLVANIFSNFIKHYPLILRNHGRLNVDDATFQRISDKWFLTLWKHSLINPKLSAKDTKIAESILQAYRSCNTFDDFKTTTIAISKKNTPSLYELAQNDRLMSRYFSNNLYQQACAQVIGANSELSSVFAAVVQGGRCNNSNPFESQVQYVADIDMSSCYGSTLRKLQYPIGLPTIDAKAQSHGQLRDEYFKKHQQLERELVDDLWIADVSTKQHLSFSQDLIFSSYGLSPSIISNAVTGSYEELDEEIGEKFTVEGDIKKVPNEFALTRSQIEHGKLAASSHRALKAVATDKEIGELKKQLEAHSFVYYPASKRINDIESFCDHMLSDSGAVEVDKDLQLIDTRSRHWFPVDLELFIGVLVEKRKVAKTDMKKTQDDELRGRLDAKQGSLKLCINTLYGVFCSVYFSLGNVVLANVITDKARVNAWMMSKSLRTRQEITDGGFYSVLEVAYNRGEKLPGLDVLSDYRKWVKTHKANGIRRTIEPLGELSEDEWKAFFEIYAKNQKDTKLCTDAGQMLDNLALTHIESFWKRYGLTFEFQVEHKYEHTAWSAGYLGKSDYCLNTINGSQVIKKRGARARSPHPGKELLSCLSNGDTSSYKHRGYTDDSITKIPEYQRAKIQPAPVANPKTISELKTAGLVVPGWSYEKYHDPTQINNTHCYLRDYSDYERRKKRKAITKGERLQWFERYVQESGKMLKAMNDNSLR